MSFHLKYKPYKRTFRKPLNAASGTHKTREGIIIELSSPNGKKGYGEIVFTFDRGLAKPEQIDLFLKSLKGTFHQDTLHTLSSEFAPVKWAFSTAQAWALHQLPLPLKPHHPSTVLLSSGAEGIAEYSGFYAQGYRTFKWKIGIKPLHEEIKLWKRWKEQLAQDVKIRFDANKSLDSDKALEWFKILEDDPRIEFIEQPLPPAQIKEMITLSKKTAIPLALDESLQIIPLPELETLKWSGFVAIKPCLIGDLSTFLQWRMQTDLKCIYSSSFETLFGLKPALDLAMSDERVQSYALGFGVFDFFTPDLLSKGVSFKNGSIYALQQPIAFFEDIWNQL